MLLVRVRYKTDWVPNRILTLTLIAGFALP